MIIDFRERGREREKNISQLPLAHAHTGDQTCNLGNHDH